MTYAQFTLLFLAGVGASLHCLGMCGAFALAAGRRGLLLSALYTLGRLLSYTAIGAVVGAIGKSLWTLAALSGLQSILAVALGIVMILLGLRMLGLFPATSWSERFRPSRIFASSMSALMPPAGPTQALTLGLLNGLLPCPVIHAFLPIAIVSGSLQGGAASMFTLGLGTVPAMFVLGTLGSVQRLRPFKGWLARGPGIIVLLYGMVTVARIGLMSFHRM